MVTMKTLILTCFRSEINELQTSSNQNYSFQNYGQTGYSQSSLNNNNLNGISYNAGNPGLINNSTDYASQYRQV